MQKVKFIKKLMSAASTLLVGTVVILAILLVGIRLVGLTPYAVLSGSMEPTYPVGSLIYVKAIAPEDITAGTPITFTINKNLVLATHRVVEVEKRTTREEPLLNSEGKPIQDENGKTVMQTFPLAEPAYFYRTKGDANEAVDGSLVYYKNVVGTPVFSIPKLGYLSNWLQTPRGMILGGSIALVLLILTFIPDLLAMVDEAPAKKRRKKKRRRRKKGAKPRREMPPQAPYAPEPYMPPADDPFHGGYAPQPYEPYTPPAQPYEPAPQPYEPYMPPAQSYEPSAQSYMPSAQPYMPPADPVPPASAPPQRRRRRAASPPGE